MILCNMWNFSSSEDSPWEQVLHNVGNSEIYRWHSRTFYSRFIYEQPNHPLVKKKIAYWHTDDTLCIGYRLKQNPQIFRPIYNRHYAKLICNLLPHIPTIVKKREKYLAYKEIVKIKKLPIVIVDEIIKYI